MRVMQIEGEPTRYHVESSSLECVVCGRNFTRRDPKNKALRIGGPCPKCAEEGKEATLDTKFHLVDLSSYFPIGQCSCEHFQFRLLANISKLAPSVLRIMSKGEASKLRCTHIEAAREEALDKTIYHHEEHRHAQAGKQREGIGA